MIVAMLALTLVMVGCGGSGDDNASGMGTARVVLTDAPLSDVQEVHVHITRVEVVSSGGGVRTLLTDSEIPDDIELIALAANPLLLGQPLIPAGQYTQVRLILNPAPGANYIIDGDGVRHDLTVPSGSQTGAKLVTGAFTIREGEIVTILLDFHAAASVHRAGQSGMWIMRPTIFATVVDGVQLDFGVVRGTVLDGAGAPLAVPPGQVLGVFIETPFGPIGVGEVDPEDGGFEIPAILAGEYDLRVRYADPDGWEPVGDPLDLIVNGGIEQLIHIILNANETITLDIVVALQ
ncbi:MAG: DUF4382 domain-containing protein [Armatimonadota bacterium]